MRSRSDTVVDASFIVPLIADALGPSVRASSARAALGRAGALVAPSLLLFEILNALRGGSRARLLTPKDIADSLMDAFDLCVHLEPAPDIVVALRISELAEAHGLTAYDASYLELALRTKSPLATFDDALAKAARAEGVEVIGVSAN